MPPVDPSSTTGRSDDQLVARTLAGDRSAFNELIRRHEGKLFRLLSRMADNSADVEDAMQQALVKSYVHLARYNPRWSFGTWLYAIALRELRTLQRRPKVAQLAADVPARKADENDLWHVSRKILNPTQFTIPWLAYGENLPARDIAKIVARPRVWVSVTLHRARCLLRQNLDRDGQMLKTDRERPFTVPGSKKPARGAI